MEISRMGFLKVNKIPEFLNFPYLHIYLFIRWLHANLFLEFEDIADGVICIALFCSHLL